MGVRLLILALWLSSIILAHEGPVVINEIHYDPVPKTDHVEFIELYNRTKQEVDLSGWSIVEGAYYQFPQGVRLAPGGYLVVAGEPQAVKARFGVTALGPWQGRLSNEGETLVLCDQAKRVMDKVSFKLGFPWPTVGDPPGYSIELINPWLDNSLAGNWRASKAGAGSAMQPIPVFGLTQVWRYNQDGVDLGQAWRQVGFDDSSWASGQGLLYVEDAASVEPKNTPLTLGRITYYFRTSFEFTGDPARTALQFSLMVDDGAVLYLNGQEFYRIRMPDGQVNYNTLASSSVGDASLAGPMTVAVPSLVKGRNVLAAEVHQSSANSSDIVFGMTLTLVDAGVVVGDGPTPGRANSVLSGDAPPCIWDVAHDPVQPASGQDVVITATVLDPNGVKSVELLYQIVEPGRYYSKADPEYEAAQNWSMLSMRDDGVGVDRLKADGIYTAVIPGAVQVHRRLIRYRIRAADLNGNVITVPYADDPQPNFAYFVYDGLPPWLGAIQPGSPDRLRNALVVYDFAAMPALPVYHLITTRKAHEESQYIPNSTAGQYWGQDYPWYGTLVYDEVVYDHIRFRARGGVWRYSMGKNMWKFDFNRGHDFQARDEYGRPLRVGWKKLNLGANIQQGDYGHRGEQGLFEYVGFRLYNLACCPASITFPVHFRIIENPSETNDTPNNQYDDDFQGLYLAVEQPDGRFLDQHNLPDGNLYKMEGGTGELNNQGRDHPSDKSDL
ncbi:MAG: lamin tail domain-containing protein, partial [Sedimentisphaerales bacterium]|nr:lamin tail domain-containing protein [Sedimentisphaerales bacterium]